MKTCILFFLLLAVFSLPAQVFPVVSVLNNGDDAQRINFVVLSDGYTSGQLDDFVTDAGNISNQLFNKAPFKQYEHFFNVYAIRVPSNESGADHPGTATDVGEPAHPVTNVDNYFGSTFDYFNIHRLLVPINTGNILSVLATNFPGYDQVVMLTNAPYYGGSGGAFATTSLEASAPEIAIHELGHSFAALADEYWAGDSYAAEKPNMSANSNPNTVKWSEWVGESGINVYVHGTSGVSANWYRPHQSCEMRFLNQQFCGVCREAFIDKIYDLTDPIDSYSPVNNNPVFSGTPINFSLDLVFPSPNTLKVEWLLNGSTFATDVNAILLDGGDLPLTNNALVANIIDTTLMSKSYAPSSGYVFSVNWNIKNSVLPLELIDFQAIQKEPFINLNWTTAREVNIEQYEIERSEDGETFKHIKTVTASGNNNETQAYTTIDEQPLEGKSYYRLKIMEESGQYEFSPIRVVNRVEKFFFKVYPNPAQDFVLLHYSNNSFETDLSAELLNAAGQTLKSISLNGAKGIHQVEIDLSDLAAGIYFVRLHKGGFVRDIEVLKN